MRSSARGKAPLSATASANSQPAASTAAPKPAPALHPLSAYGLLPSILEAAAARGITSLFGWQAAALATPRVLEEAVNLLYTAPTSGGKTVVAEVLALRRLQEGGAHAKALFVLPFRAIVAEKHADFKKLLKGSGINVAEYSGPVGALPVPRRTNLAVCTIEKALLLVHSLANEGRLHELKAVVVDEFHMVGKPQRRALERLLTLLVFWSRKQQALAAEQRRLATPGALPRSAAASASASASGAASAAAAAAAAPQIIGMSATMSNLGTLQTWLLDAQRHEARLDTRPVKLVEHLVCVDGGTCERLTRGPTDAWERCALPEASAAAAAAELAAVDRIVVALCEETCAANEGVVVFCSTKKTVAALAAALARSRVAAGAAAADAERQYRLAFPEGGMPGLVDAIGGGVGFHHADLGAAEKTFVESAFAKGELRVIVATTTLGAGVNLPVRRVVIRDGLQVGGDKLEKDSYLQMGGRAGRTGLSGEGEAFLLCQSKEVDKVRRMVCGPMPELKSQLLKVPPKAPPGTSQYESLAVLLLELIGCGQLKGKTDMMLVAASTLWGTEEAIRFVEKNPNHTLHRGQIYVTETRKGPFLPPEVLNALHEALNQIGYAEPSKKGPFAMKRLADLIEYAPAAAAPPTPTQGAASVPASAAGGPSRNEFRLTGQGRSSAAVAFKQGLVRSSEIERDFKLVRTEGVMLGPSPLHLVYLCTAKSEALDAAQLRQIVRICAAAERGAVASGGEGRGQSAHRGGELAQAADDAQQGRRGDPSRPDRHCRRLRQRRRAGSPLEGDGGEVRAAVECAARDA